MDNSFIIKTQLEISAQKIISQIMLTNESMEKEIEQGVRQAFERFDFVECVENAVTSCIERAIKESSNYGKISETVHKKADEIIDQYIQSSIDKFRKDFKSE